MKPLEIVKELEAMIGLDGRPVAVTLAIETVLIGSFNVPAIQAAEKAGRYAARVVNGIEERFREHQDQGTISVLCVLGSAQDMVAGSCYVLPGDAQDIQGAKRNRLSAQHLLAAIRALTFDQFEKFGSRVLRELGAQKVRVTPQSNDQGIDFYGVLNLGLLQQVPPAFFKLAHDVEIRFAGQAKHYPDRAVGSAAVRELVGAISLARHKTYSNKLGDDLFEDFGLKPFNPLLALLFSTGEITSGARSLSSGAGVIVKSGEQIAVFLADRGVGMNVADGGAVVFDQAIFDDWLLQP